MSARPSFLAAVAVLIVLALPTSARASERVVDGGFDQLTTCVVDIGGDCTNPAWSETVSGTDTGPICEPGIGNCGFFIGAGGVFPSTPPGWLQFGGESTGGFTTDSWSVSQVVQIPAAPATLGFDLMIRNADLSAGTAVVRLDGAPVFGAAGTTPGFDSYAPVQVDVSGFAGGTHLLSFEAVDEQMDTGSSDSINVDNVSLNAPDVALPATSPPTPASPTGQRAAALKKCKKKKSKKARKKCRRRAQAVPV